MTTRVATLFLLGTLAVAAAPAQDPAERREKVRTILRTQDLRSTRTAFLRRYLYDPDTLVRTRAALACGSLQDTTLLPELLETLTGAPPEAQEAAAFAIGQTGGILSPAGIEELAHELIWVRLDRTAARERLIPEIGKFGTATALSELLLRLGTGSPDDAGPLTMAVARFAIRGVKNEEATRYVLNRALDARTPDWTAAYALQRIGDEPLVRAEIPRLAGLVRHRDPLVRMHAAALFGKLGRDPALAEPLARLAEFDADWRVRVSALRALGAQAPAGIVAEAFATALRAEESAVVLTSLAALGGYADSSDRAAEGIRSLVPAIAALARGEDRAHRWQYRSAAAMTLAVIEGERAVPEIRPADAGDRLLKGGLLAALGATGGPAAEEPIAAHLADGDPHVRRTALEAHTALARSLRSDAALVRRAYDANVAALGSGDMAVITTAASHLADTLFPGPPSVAPLIAALERLRSPADIEAIQEVCRTLGRLGDRSAVGPLERLLEAGDPPAALAAAAALTAITGSDHRGRLRPDREPLHVDFDFERLEALPDTLRMTLETERGEIVMEWYPGAAPFTILSLLRLAENEGFYRGLIFHRVVPNFVIQGGDPRGDGWGGPGYAIRSEFSPATYGTGSVGIASAGKDTEGSQFFITHSPQPHLDGRYTWIGRVTAGMEVVDAIQVGDRILDLRRSR